MGDPRDMTWDDLLRLYRDGSQDERRAAMRELDRRKHAEDIERIKSRRLTPLRIPKGKTWFDGRAAAAGDAREDE